MSQNQIPPAAWTNFRQSIPLLLYVILISLAHAIFVYPFKSLLARETKRFKVLKALRLDALCQSLLDHGDFDFLSKKEPIATERELQRVAYHISKNAALGALVDYPQVKAIFGYQSFWVLLNGNAEQERFIGIAIGFYIGVAACVAGAIIVRAVS